MVKPAFSFTVKGTDFVLPLLGEMNIYNSLCAITVAKVLGLSLEEIKRFSGAMKNIPGRQEFINEGQNFKVLVDYAFEPKALASLYEILEMIPHKRLIHVLGSAGGGRDVARRPVLGSLAGENAQIVIVTNEDPYDDDSEQIIEEVAQGASEKSKIEGQDLFKILDRREAIKKALQLAKEGDLVLVTGKGSEQAICVGGGQKLPWDDRKVIREELVKI